MSLPERELTGTKARKTWETEQITVILICNQKIEIFMTLYCCCSVTKSYLTLRHHGLQHSRLLCPPLSPGACSNSRPLRRRCHPTIPSSVIPFSSCLQSFPASGSLPMSQFFASGGQRTGVSASVSVLPMNIQDWFPLGWIGWIPLLFKGLSRVYSSTTIWEHQFFSAQPSLWSNSYVCTWLQEKPQLWLYGPLLPKWCLCFLICCPRFFPFMAAVTIFSDFGAQGKKICHRLCCFPFSLPWSGWDRMPWS